MSRLRIHVSTSLNDFQIINGRAPARAWLKAETGGFNI